MTDNCPWCDAPIQTEAPNDPDHLEWTCGSAQRGPDPWQSPDCRTAVAEIDVERLKKEIRKAMKTIETLIGKLLRVRVQIKYHANSVSGVVAEIDKVLDPKRKKNIATCVFCGAEKTGKESDGINPDHR